MNRRNLTLCSLLILATAKGYFASLELKYALQHESQASRFLASKLEGCQFVLVTDWGNDEAPTFIPLEQLLPQLHKSYQPTELWDVLDEFQRWTYTFKHAATNIAIVNFPTVYYGYRLEQIIFKMASKSYQPPYQTELDLVVTVLTSETFKRLNLYFVKESYAWALPANSLIVSYDPENGNTLLEIRVHRFRCPDEEQNCIETLDIAETGAGLNYKSIMHELRLRRHNFHEYDLGIVVPTAKDIHISDDTLLQPFRDRRSWMHQSFITIPFFYVAQALNITLLPFRHASRTEGWILYQSATSISGSCGLTADNCAAIFFEKRREHKVVHPYAHQSVGDPSNLRSIVKPFELILWILFGGSMLGVAALHICKSKDRTRLLLGLIAPFIGQGVDYPLGPKTKSSLAIWLIFVVLMSFFYGSGIQSSRIKPGSRQLKITWAELIEQDYKFYTSPTVWKHFMKNNQDYTMKYKENFDGPDRVREIKFLKSRLRPVNGKNIKNIQDLMLSGSTVWYIDHDERESYEYVMRHILNLNFVYVKFLGQTATVWKFIEVPHGDVILTLYKNMIEAGWTEFWETFNERAALLLRIQMWTAIFKAHDHAKGTGIVTLENSLALEGICLWGFGIAAAFFLFVAQVAIKIYGCIKARLMNRVSRKESVQEE